LPAASLARIVIVLVPTSSRIAGVLQFSVPLATPDPPFELAHVTATTPVLSRAVPLTTIAGSDRNKVVEAGETMVSEGAVVSGPVAGFE
jgi:hypothetical protein